MAYCRMTGVTECDGCGECAAEAAMYDEYDDTLIYPGEEYYDFDGFIVAKENLEKWARGYMKVAD